MKIKRRLSKNEITPLEQYGYYDIEFDSKKEYKENYLKIIKTIAKNEQKIRGLIKKAKEKKEDKELAEEFEREGSFISKK